MSAQSLLRGCDSTKPVTTRCLHAVRSEWLEPTLRHGLDRPSAAWFELPGHDRTGLTATTAATLAAAVYLALGLNRPDELAAEPSYTDWFRTHPTALATFVEFEGDCPAQAVKSYLWAGHPSPSPIRTHPYTKVDLSGAPPWHVRRVRRAGLEEVRQAEEAARRDRPPSGDDHWHTHMRPLIPGRADPLSAPIVPTRLAAFCWHLGRLIWA
jgi:hypothetical protein